MIYPINMHNAEAGGFAVANDHAEHEALSAADYEPKLVSEQEPVVGESETPKRKYVRKA